MVRIGPSVYRVSFLNAVRLLTDPTCCRRRVERPRLVALLFGCSLPFRVCIGVEQFLCTAQCGKPETDGGNKRAKGRFGENDRK